MRKVVEVSGGLQPVWALGAQLGEGPVWVARDRALWFTDIKRRQVHRFDPASGTRQSWTAPEPVGFVFPSDDGNFVAGLQSGLFRFDPGASRFDRLVAVEPDLPGNRLNDGVVDPAGRLWFGTMDDGEKARTGAIHCYDRGRLTRTAITGIRITNGPAVSPDGRTLYWVDTLGGTIWACPIGPDGTLGDSRELTRIAPDEGHPDGPTVDSQGGIWVGLYAGWEARHFSPGGELLDRIRFPVSNITKLAFGGPDLKTLFATTARHLLTAEQLAGQPLAGALFQWAGPVAGVPSPPVAL